VPIGVQTLPPAARRLTSQGGDRMGIRSKPSTEAQSLMSRESDRRPRAWQQVRSLRRAIVQGRRADHLPPRALHGALVRLERSAVKVACCVLRGLGEGDLAWLPGDDRKNCLSERMTENRMSEHSGDLP
jgi:hypothetical protein